MNPGDELQRLVRLIELGLSSDDRAKVFSLCAKGIATLVSFGSTTLCLRCKPTITSY
jgi:hypothetical protein